MNFTALLAGLLSGIIGGMGMGGGAVLIIYLSLFTDTKQLTAQGINLLFFIPIGILALIIYTVKKQIKWKSSGKNTLLKFISSSSPSSEAVNERLVHSFIRRQRTENGNCRQQNAFKRWRRTRHLPRAAHAAPPLRRRCFGAPSRRQGRAADSALPMQSDR